MFGLTSLVYARDYFQGLQSQWKAPTDVHGNEALCTQALLGGHESAKSRKTGQGKENFEVQASSTVASSPLTLKPTSPRKHFTTPLSFLQLDQQNPRCQGAAELIPKSNNSSPPDSLFNLEFTCLSPKVTALSLPPASSRHNFESDQRQVSSPGSYKKVYSELGSRNDRQHVTRSTTLGAPPNTKALSQIHVQPWLYSFSDRERTSSPIAHGGSKFQRLSTLRESSGNICPSVESGQQNLGSVIRKTRHTAKPVLHVSDPVDEVCQSVVDDCSLNSLFSAKLSFSEDYPNGEAFLGRHRAPSSPELRFAQSSEYFHQGQNFPRASSFTNLRHIPADRKRSLYIGVNNRQIFLPPKSDRSSTPVVLYRLPALKERRTPSMTPLAIIGPGDSHRSQTIMSFIPVTHRHLASLVDSAGSTRRTASNTAVAGSNDSSGSDETIRNVRSGVVIAPAETENTAQQRIIGLPFVESGANIIHPPGFLRKSVLQMPNTYTETTSMAAMMVLRRTYSDSIFRMMNVIFVPSYSSSIEIKNSPKSVQPGFYHEFTPDMTLLRTISVNSKTSFDEPFKAIDCIDHVTNNKIQLQKCRKSPCDILTDHDEAYACWHPESVDHEEEKQPFEHSTSSLGDCSTIIAPIRSTKKLKGFWAKIGSIFKGCFGADQDV